MPATSRATVVLPVPGLPMKTRCRVRVGLRRPASARSFSTRSSATWRCTSRLTVAQADQRVELGEQLLHRPGRCGRALLRRRGHGRRCARRDRVGGAVSRGRGGGRCGRHGPRRPRRARDVRQGARRTELAGGLQLGGGGDRGVADHPHRRLAEAARGRRDLGERPRVGRRGGRPGGDEERSGSRSGTRASDDRGRRRRRSPGCGRRPGRAAQSAGAPGADSATAAASAAPSARATSAATPAPAATVTSASRASPSEVTCPVPVLMACPATRREAAAGPAPRGRGR